MKVINLKIKNISTFIVGFFIFLLLKPSFSWNYINSISQIITLAVVSYFWINLNKNSSTNLLFLIFFGSVLILAAISKNSNVLGLFMFLLMAAVPFISSIPALKLYNSFKSIFAFVLVISLILYVLILIGIPITPKYISPLNSVKSYSYLSYPLLVIPVVPDYSMLNFRFHGPFDEPGVIGTIGIIILYIEKFKINKIQNAVILIAGLLTFSLFFYISSFIYLIINLNRKYSFWGLILLIIVVSYTFENDFLNKIIWNRFSWDVDRNTLAGDNRTSTFLDSYFDQIKGTSTFYWGGASVSTLANFEESSSYKNAIISYGFIPCFLYGLFFLIFGYWRLKLTKEYILYILIFIGTLYQRPMLFYIYFIFLFTIYTLDQNKLKINYILNKSEKDLVNKLLRDSS